MSTRSQHSFNEITEALLKGERVEYYLNYLKANTFAEDELSGLKQYFENNSYNSETLKSLLSPPELKVLKPAKVIHLNYKIAAALLLIVLFAGMIRIFTAPSSPETDKYWVEDQGFKVYMGITDTRLSLNNGMSFYRIGDYKQALNEFTKVSENDTAMYYSAISFFKLKQLDSAEIYFKRIDVLSKYYNKTQYYLALTYIALDRQTEARQVLTTNKFDLSEMEEAKSNILKDMK